MPVPDFVRQLREKVGHDLLLLPGVAAIVLNDRDEALLVRPRDGDAWTPIGGYLEPGEQPADAVAREVAEKSGLSVVPERIVCVEAEPARTLANGDRVQPLTVVFRCRPTTRRPPRVADDESSAVRYFAPEGVPADVAPHHLRWIALALDGRRGGSFLFRGAARPV